MKSTSLGVHLPKIGKTKVRGAPKLMCVCVCACGFLSYCFGASLSNRPQSGALKARPDFLPAPRLMRRAGLARARSCSAGDAEALRPALGAKLCGRGSAEAERHARNLPPESLGGRGACVKLACVHVGLRSPWANRHKACGSSYPPKVECGHRRVWVGNQGSKGGI